MTCPAPADQCTLCRLADGAAHDLAGRLARHGIATGHPDDLAAWLDGSVVLECVGDEPIVVADHTRPPADTDATGVVPIELDDGRPGRPVGVRLDGASYAVADLAGVAWVTFRVDADLDRVTDAVVAAVLPR